MSAFGDFQGPQGEEGPAGTDQRVVCIPVTHPDDAISTGDAQGAPFWAVPAFNGMILTHVFVGLDTTGTGTTTVQVRNVTQSWDILSTAATIDTGEATTLTASCAPGDRRLEAGARDGRQDRHRHRRHRGRGAGARRRAHVRGTVTLKQPVELIGVGGGGFSDGDHPLNNGCPTAGMREGDIWIMYHYAASSAAGRSMAGGAAIAGWTVIHDDPDGGANGGYLAAWWRRWDPSLNPTVSIPGTGFDGGSTSGDTTFTNCIGVRGAHPTNPIPQLGTIVNGAQGDFGPIPGLTIAEGSAVLFYGGKDNTDGYTALTNQQSLTWTTVLAGSSTAGGNGSAFGQFGGVAPAGGQVVSNITIVTSGGALAMKARMLEIAVNPRRDNPSVVML